MHTSERATLRIDRTAIGLQATITRLGNAAYDFGDVVTSRDIDLPGE